jgi:hypothetical protein
MLTWRLPTLRMPTSAATDSARTASLLIASVLGASDASEEFIAQRNLSRDNRGTPLQLTQGRAVWPCWRQKRRLCQAGVSHPRTQILRTRIRGFYRVKESPHNARAVQPFDVHALLLQHACQNQLVVCTNNTIGEEGGCCSHLRRRTKST